MSNSFLSQLMSEFEFPLQSPVLVFSVILFIILMAPLLLGRIRVPGIIGFIISGIVIGPYGLNMIEKNSAVDLFSTIGLLYIMFIAGLELDLNEFKKKKYKSLTFGFFTFLIPLLIGYPACYYLLDFSVETSILTASMFATHTLVTYPIVTKFGVSKNEAVAISVGGTILTDTAVLIILAVIMGSHSGSLNLMFWVRLIISLTLFSLFMFLLVPKVTKWFFTKLESEKTSHFIFVLSTVFWAAFLAHLAGVEPIIGAFVAGLALNPVIPHSSTLMNRIEFTGNALFIPFFLISVGMIVDLRVIFQGPQALIVAGVLTVVALLGKWLAARLTGLVYKYSKAQSQVIFGLSSAHAAATLAIILVGYNAKIIDINILNGTVILILITCIVASFVTESAAKKLVASEEISLSELNSGAELEESILLPIANFNNLESMMDLAILLKDKKSLKPIHLLSVVNNNEDAERNIKQARKKLEGLVSYASGSESVVDILTTIDYNAASGVVRTSKEKEATIILSGWPRKQSFLNKFIADKTEYLIESLDKNLFICNLNRPINVFERIVVSCPPFCEEDEGFKVWLNKLCSLSKELSAGILCYCSLQTQKSINEFLIRNKLNSTFIFNDFIGVDNIANVKSVLKSNDLLFFVAARKESHSYQRSFEHIQIKLERLLPQASKILIFPQVNPLFPETLSS